MMEQDRVGDKINDDDNEVRHRQEASTMSFEQQTEIGGADAVLAG